MGLHEFFYYGKPEPKPVSRNLLKAFEDEREILVRLVLVEIYIQSTGEKEGSKIGEKDMMNDTRILTCPSAESLAWGNSIKALHFSVFPSGKFV